MNQTALIRGKSYTAQKIILWLLLLGLLLFLTRIGARHYFRDEAVKTGTFPVMVGRVFALWAIALLLLQPVLAARLRFLDRVFGLDRLLKFHRFSGIACLILTSSHPMLMYVSGLKKLGPLSSEQWPEALGGICIVGLWLAVVSSVWRKFLALSYEEWIRLHKFMAPVVILALSHMFIIESAMRKGWLLGFWIVLLVLWASIVIAAKVVFPAQRAASEAFVVSSVSAEADKIWQISLKPAADIERFSFLPGQFAFISVESSEIPHEEHPFTIASAPADSASLQFLIKASGDWTKKLSAVRTGDKVRVSGPFGVFSSYRHQASSLIMIAGGIGITPMLSTLRQLSHEKSDLPVKLIWSYRTSAEAPCLAEIESLRQALPNLEIEKIVSRESSAGKDALTRLDKPALAKLMPEFKAGALVMLCGPTAMMSDVRVALQALGYPSSAMLCEEFSL
ncbi:MAG: ferric reductase-like transmembrane domain-containing protein [Candidatus Riflebacteria bacterium]|nr:ferric reductase-like transmembrane domain-containing protein [Candidatus Riflebacteria bacterium]